MRATSVRQIIERERLVECSPGVSVKDAVARMCEHCCGSIVLKDDGRIVGIFTERDLMRRVVHAGLDPAETPVGAVMTPDPDTIDAEAPVMDAIRAMDECSYRYLPVIENGACVGVISTRHLPFSEVIAMAPELEARHRLAEQLW